MVIKIHDLRPAPGANREKIRVGRGEGSKGKTAGRGTKGTKARKNVSPRFEGGQMPLHMRLPKLRGFKNRFRTEYQGINVGRLAEAFPEGGSVGIEDLIAAGLVHQGELVKILGDGDLEGVQLQVTAHAFSGSAQEKLAAAGGSATKVAPVGRHGAKNS
jgi:large subunit ribosomal protein L15